MPWSGAASGSIVMPMSPPDRVSWLFWETDPSSLDAERHADHILARVLEFGGLPEVRWAMDYYGLERIHEFFRSVGHPELSPRTIQFWRAVFLADKEPWAERPAWRKSSSSSWTD